MERVRFLPIASIGIWDGSAFAKMVALNSVLKMLMEVVLTSVMHPVAGSLEWTEDVDTIDPDTRFKLFCLRDEGQMQCCK